MTTHTPLSANQIARRSPYKRRHNVYLQAQVQTDTEYETARESKDKKVES